ncbi:MAG: hypothetical protein Greene041679_564 [Parcubacteria group bacterium Greene0416_79]|nr:MAG: hypothetical protein Greene041679_564 [Parcubacteria group bacterium Greene0416_79]
MLLKDTKVAFVFIRFISTDSYISIFHLVSFAKHSTLPYIETFLNIENPDYLIG